MSEVHLQNTETEFNRVKDLEQEKQLIKITLPSVKGKLQRISLEHRLNEINKILSENDKTNLNEVNKR